MNLKFTCQNCGADIIVKLLHRGEIECRLCGSKNVVPEAAFISEEPDNSDHQQDQLRRAEKHVNRMLYGIFCSVAGVIITYGLTSSTGGIIAWGTILFGIFKFLQGFWGWRRKTNKTKLLIQLIVILVSIIAVGIVILILILYDK